MNQALAEFFDSISFVIEVPSPYGLLHLSFLFGGTALCVILLYGLRKVSPKTGDRILFLCGIILALMEVYKQLFYYYNNGQSYPWRIFPFQLCSVPMYLCLLLPVFKSRKIRQMIYDFIFIFSTLGGTAVLLCPSGVMSKYLTINIHSFVWHIILVFIGMFVVVGKKANVDISAFKNAAIIFICLSVIAFIINCVFTDVSDGTITMFFIGPNIPNVVVFKDLATNYGWFVSTIVYILCLLLGGYLVFLLTDIILHKFSRNSKNKAVSQILDCGKR